MKFSSCLKAWITKALVSIAKISVHRPAITVVTVLVLSASTLTVGVLTNFSLESDGFVLWTPVESISRIHGRWVRSPDSGFPLDGRPIQIVLHKQGKNLLTTNDLKLVFEVGQLLENIPGFEKVCGGPLQGSKAPLCSFLSPSLFWSNDYEIFDNSTSSNDDVVYRISHLTFPDGQLVNRPTLFGSALPDFPAQQVDPRGEYQVEDVLLESVAAFMIILNLPNDEDNALPYELVATEALFALADTWQNEKSNDDFDTAMSLELFTSRSFDDELLRGIEGDIPYVALAYFMMGCFCAVTLYRKDPVSSQTLLGLGAVFTVALSLMTGYGMIMLCNVPFTYLLQVFPYVLIGIGLDDTYILMGAFSRTKQTDSMEQRVECMMEDVGVSITVSSLTTFLAFLLGAFSSLPALQFFAYYAAPAVMIDFLYQVTFFLALLALDVRRQKNRRRDCCPCCPVEFVEEPLDDTELFDDTEANEDSKDDIIVDGAENANKAFYNKPQNDICHNSEERHNDPSKNEVTLKSGDSQTNAVSNDKKMALDSLSNRVNENVGDLVVTNKDDSLKTSTPSLKSGDSQTNAVSNDKKMAFDSLSNRVNENVSDLVVTNKDDSLKTSTLSLKSGDSQTNAVSNDKQMALDSLSDRVNENVGDLVVTNKDDTLKTSTPSYFARVVAQTTDLLLKPISKVLVLISFAGLLIAGSFGAAQLDQNFDYQSLVPPDSFVRTYQHSLDTYFDEGQANRVLTSYCYFRDIDVSSPPNQGAMMQYVNETSNLDIIDGFPTSFWLADFFVFSLRENFDSSEVFYDQLDTFLSTEPYKTQHAEDIVRDESRRVIASRVKIDFTGVDTTENQNQVNALKQQQDVSSAQPLNAGLDPEDWPLFSFGLVYYAWELYAVIAREVFQGAILGLLAVFVVALLFLQHPLGAFIVAPVVVMVYVNLMGLLYLAGISINTTSCVGLTMSIGLVVDYNMHVVHSFLDTSGSGRNERVKKVMNTMGKSILLGGLSTLLGVLPLAFSQSDVFRTFFFTYLGIVILGTTHGLILTPVLLSIIGPPHVPPAELTL